MRIKTDYVYRMGKKQAILRLVVGVLVSLVIWQALMIGVLDSLVA